MVAALPDCCSTVTRAAIRVQIAPAQTKSWSKLCIPPPNKGIRVAVHAENTHNHSNDELIWSTMVTITQALSDLCKVTSVASVAHPVPQGVH